MTTTQRPPSPEHAIGPQDHHPVTSGYPHHSPASAYPAPVQPTPAQPAGYPAVAYPQEGATAYPTPVPYAQPGTQPPPVPYAQPGAQTSPAGYSTAPPWAAAPAAPAGPDAPTEEPFTQHGGLLVPFPEEMRHASRSQAPAVWPVAVFTLLSGVLGLVSAGRRAGQARRTHNSTAPYWLTFLIAAAAGAFLWFVIAAVVIGPMVTELREGRSLEAVQRNVVGDGQLKKAQIAVTSAQCRAVTERNADGMRDYLCQLSLAEGGTASLTLTADESGQWRSR